jgi:hypothetical protein
VKFVHLTGTPNAFFVHSFNFIFLFGVGHSKKNATLTSFAAEFATEIERLRATIELRIKTLYFFHLFLSIDFNKCNFNFNLRWL